MRRHRDEKGYQETPYLTQEDTEKIINTCMVLLKSDHARMRRIGLLGIVLNTTMLRSSEVCRICVEDVDFKRCELQVWRHKKRGRGYQKGVKHSGAKRDTILLDEKFFGIIAYYLEKSGNPTSGPILVSQKTGVAIKSRQVARDWAFLLQKAEVTLGNGGWGATGVHIARRSGASRVVGGGADALYLKLILGHDNLSTVSVYVQKSQAMLQRASKYVSETTPLPQIGIQER